MLPIYRRHQLLEKARVTPALFLAAAFLQPLPERRICAKAHGPPNSEPEGEALHKASVASAVHVLVVMAKGGRPSHARM